MSRAMMESSVVQRVSRGGVDLPAAVRGSHESSRGLLQAASARDGAQAKRCFRPLLATFGIDALVCIRESVGREPTVRTTAADSGQDGQQTPFDD
jgi:hypothetical protein